MRGVIFLLSTAILVGCGANATPSKPIKSASLSAKASDEAQTPPAAPSETKRVDSSKSAGNGEVMINCEIMTANGEDPNALDIGMDIIEISVSYEDSKEGRPNIGDTHITWKDKQGIAKTKDIPEGAFCYLMEEL